MAKKYTAVMAKDDREALEKALDTELDICGLQIVSTQTVAGSWKTYTMVQFFDTYSTDEE